jgi:hypothetical protein
MMGDGSIHECSFAQNCVRICPKKIPLTTLISHVYGQVMQQAFVDFFSQVKAAILCDLARRLGKGRYFPYASTADILDELREASRGGVADYYGITYDKVDRQMGVFWPCPSLDHRVPHASWKEGARSTPMASAGSWLLGGVRAEIQSPRIFLLI